MMMSQNAPENSERTDAERRRDSQRGDQERNWGSAAMTTTEPISTARIRNVEVPMIAHADIKHIPTVEGPVKDEDLGRALEALNDRRLATPGKVHLYEGEARNLGSVAQIGRAHV